MTMPEPSIRVAVDLTNPGQFFACCGLLELADRLWGNVEGWFSERTFCLRPLDVEIRAVASLVRLIDELVRCRVENTMTADQLDRAAELSHMNSNERAKSDALQAEKKALDSLRREAPIQLHGPFNLRIDWFLDKRAGGSRYKTWAGQQSVIDIAEGMHRALLESNWSGSPPAEWLSRSATTDGLPFYFDSGLSSQGSALDAGFSFDPLGFQAPTRPLLEFAAFVGLQRFRPAPVPSENLHRYGLWSNPLLPSAAAAAASGAVMMSGARWYEFRLLYRTDYLKSFLPAQPYRGNTR